MTSVKSTFRLRGKMTLEHYIYKGKPKKRFFVLSLEHYELVTQKAREEQCARTQVAEVLISKFINEV